MGHWGFNMEIDEIPVGRAKDLRGQKFGKLTVLYRVATPPNISNKNAYWKCVCDCGNQHIVNTNVLQKGIAQSCGCLNKEKTPSNFIDETGNRYGRLLVLERGEDQYNSNGRRYVQWKCQCDCGNIILVKGDLLRNGKTKSCGCYRKDKLQDLHSKDITNQRFGKLVAISPLYKKNHYWYWQCKCDCGGQCVVNAHTLLQGDCQSCGCTKSKGEEKIGLLLSQNHIDYEKEYSFKNLKSNKNAYLRFDFYVKNSYLIEYDGIQHFQITGWGETNYNQLTKNDNIKNEYCKTHNIPLIRIPYWHYDKITIDDLRPETSQFLV